MTGPSSLDDARGGNDAAAEVARRHEAERAEWDEERQRLQEMLAHQQRVAQAGLVTAGLSHDIRNHIQTMLGNAELALDSRDPEHMTLALRLIVTTCRDVRDTAQSFLSFTSRQTAVRETSFRLGDVVASCRRLTAPLAGRDGVTLNVEIEDDGAVVGEQQLAIQAIVNLVSNAVRACSGGGKDIDGGTVTIRATRPRSTTCRIEVADDGPGIPEDIRGSLFRPFVSGERSRGGAGLGLFVTRQAVRELGGTILLRTSDEGTIFRIDLPAAAD